MTRQTDPHAVRFTHHPLAPTEAIMNTITRTAINIIIGIGALISVAAPMAGAMLLALSLFPDSPTDAIPTIIVVGGAAAGLCSVWLYSIIMEPLMPSNR